MSKHPIFSEDMEGNFSAFFLSASKSSAWLAFGVVALFAAACLFFAPIEKGGFLEQALIGISVTGVMVTWLAAQANAYQRRRTKWVAVIFLLWPLSYWYLLSEKYREVT